MLLHMLKLLLLLRAKLEPAPLHQNELSKELGLLQQEVEFLFALHLGGGASRLFSGFARGCSLRVSGGASATLCEHFSDLLSLFNAVFYSSALLLFFLLDRVLQ